MREKTLTLEVTDLEVTDLMLEGRMATAPESALEMMGHGMVELGVSYVTSCCACCNGCSCCCYW